MASSPWPPPASGCVRLAAIAAAHLLQALLAHGLGEDGIGLTEGVDPVDEVDVEFAHVHRELAHAVDQGRIGALFVGRRRLDAMLLGLLRQVEGRDGMLAHGLLILLVEFWILVLDDLAHADLGQLLGHQLLVEQAALDGGLVLNEGGNDLVQVLSADARRFLALGFGQTLDLDLELPRLRR